MIENPPFFGPGVDFFILWRIGQAVLAGASPYGVWGSYYPPATSMLFALFAMMTPAVAFSVWTTANVAFVVGTLRGRRALAWIAFAPVVLCLFIGQLDLLFVWLATLLPRKGWQSVAAAVVITLKPQLALVLLPWWLWKWMRSDRRRLLAFAGLSAVVHALPLVWHPEYAGQWLTRIQSLGAVRTAAAPSLWPLGLALGIAGAAVLGLSFILRPTEAGARATALTALPGFLMYDLSTLTGLAPAVLMVPLSWLCLALAYTMNSYMPFILLPLATSLWQWTTADEGHASRWVAENYWRGGWRTALANRLGAWGNRRPV